MGEALSDAVVGMIAWVGVTFLPIPAAFGAWNLAARLRFGWVVHVLLPPCLLACEWGLVGLLFMAFHADGDGPPGLGFTLIPALVILALTFGVYYTRVCLAGLNGHRLRRVNRDHGDFPTWPLVEIAVELKSPTEQEKLNAALFVLTTHDPFFSTRIDVKSGQTLLQGFSEQQLGSVLHHLKDDLGLGLNVSAPTVAYRETLGRRTEITHTHKTQTGGSGQFAEVTIVFEPVEPGAGYSFENRTVAEVVPNAFVPGVEKGLQSAKEDGLLAGFPVIDFKAVLVDGKRHDLDSTILAFEVAARNAFRELRDKAQPKLLEPIMKVEVTTPKDHVNDVVFALNRRRARLQGLDRRGDSCVVEALAPLAATFGLEQALDRTTRGRACFTMRYDHYEPVPGTEPPDDFLPPAVGLRAWWRQPDNESHPRGSEGATRFNVLWCVRLLSGGFEASDSHHWPA